MIDTSQTTKDTQVFKDYTQKIVQKLYESKNVKEESEDINSLIILLNWCFLTKNNFFIEDFNKKLIHPICDSYNKIKTNVLSQEMLVGIESVFQKIPKENIKTIKFILYQYINIYDTISQQNTDTYNLCQKVSKQAIKNCVQHMTKYAES